MIAQYNKKQFIHPKYYGKQSKLPLSPNELFETPTCFILSFFKFANLSGITPNSFIKINTGVYQVHCSYKSKVYSTIICTLSILVYFTAVRTSVADLSKVNPVSFFKLFRSSFSFIYKLVVIKLLWLKMESIVEILHYLETCPFLSKCRLPKIISSKFKIYSVYTLYFSVGVIHGVFGTSTGICSQLVTPQTTNPFPITDFLAQRFMTILGESQFIFFLPYQCKISLNSMTYTDYMFLVIGTLTFVSRFLMGFLCDLFLLTCVLTLLFPVYHFTTMLQNGLPLNYDPLRHYQSLRILSRKINSLIGLVVFTYISEMIFAYPINFHNLVWSPKILERLLLSLFYCSTVSVLVGSAEVCRRMQSLRNWLFEHERQINLSSTEVVLILDDLGQNSVGISASGIFTLNYYFVGTVTSLLLTYFIIRLQWTESQVGSESSPIFI